MNTAIHSVRLGVGFKEESMACGGCRGNGKRHANKGGGDLKKFAFLSSRQLRLLKSLEPPEEESAEENEEKGQN
jgi:hypothetical protein